MADNMKEQAQKEIGMLIRMAENLFHHNLNNLESTTHFGALECLNIFQNLSTYFCGIGDLVSLEKYSDSMLKIIEKIQFKELSSQEQFLYCDAIISGAEVLSHRKGEGDETLYIGGSEVRVSASEKRIESLLIFLKSTKTLLSQNQLKDLVGRALMTIGKLIMYKQRFDFLPKSLKNFEDAETNLKNVNPQLFHVCRIHHSACHRSMINQYKFMLTFKKGDPVRFKKLSKREISNRLRQGKEVGMSNTLSVQEIEEKIRYHATSSIKMLIDTHRTHKGSLDRNSESDMYSEIGGCFFDLKQYDKAIYWTNKAIEKVYKDFGFQHPHVLSGSYETLVKTYKELGDYENELKYLKRTRKYLSTRCLIIPDEDNHSLRFGGPNGESVSTDQVLAQRIHTVKKLIKQGKGKKHEKKEKKKRKKLGRFDRVCSSPFCRVSEFEKGKKFQVCSSCKTSCYCCRKCQLVHWKNGHKSMCQAF